MRPRRARERASEGDDDVFALQCRWPDATGGWVTQPCRTRTVPTGVHEARKRGLITLAVGLGLVALPMGWVLASSLIGAPSSMFFGTPVLLGWVVVGFGLGDLLFAGRLRLVVMLLALLVGIAGLVGTFAAIRALGYELVRR